MKLHLRWPENTKKAITQIDNLLQGKVLLSNKYLLIAIIRFQSKVTKLFIFEAEN